MTNNKNQRIEFSRILFDVLFGLIMFFSIDSFVGIDSPLHFAFYLFSLVILIHWWLIFKSANDIFGEVFTTSGFSLIVRIIELILIEHVVLSSSAFDFVLMIWFLIALVFINLLWTVTRRYAGELMGLNLRKAKGMREGLDNVLVVNSIVLMMFSVLALLSQYAPQPFISESVFIVFYCFFIVLTFKYRIIDLKKISK